MRNIQQKSFCCIYIIFCCIYINVHIAFIIQKSLECGNLFENVGFPKETRQNLPFIEKYATSFPMYRSFGIIHVKCYLRLYSVFIFRIVFIPSTFSPILGHHQGRIYYKNNVILYVHYYFVRRRASVPLQCAAFTFKIVSVVSVAKDI